MNARNSILLALSLTVALAACGDGQPVSEVVANSPSPAATAEQKEQALEGRSEPDPRDVNACRNYQDEMRDVDDSVGAAIRGEASVVVFEISLKASSEAVYEASEAPGVNPTLTDAMQRTAAAVDLMVGKVENQQPLDDADIEAIRQPTREVLRYCLEKANEMVSLPIIS